MVSVLGAGGGAGDAAQSKSGYFDFIVSDIFLAKTLKEFSLQVS